MTKRTKSIWTDDVIREIVRFGESAYLEGNHRGDAPFRILGPAGQRDFLNTYTKNGLSAVLGMLPLETSIECLEQLINDLRSQSIDDAVNKFVDHIAPRTRSNSNPLAGRADG